MTTKIDQNDKLDPLLTTKLHRPPLTSDLVIREPLLFQLNRRRERPFTLISAPAGYGKTTLINSWLETVECQIAWYQIDENDNDLVTFLAYVIASVQRIFPNVGDETNSFLQASQLPPISVMTASLITELDQAPSCFILVLDDFHLIQDLQIHDFMIEFLRHPSPNFQLVIGTRQDPPLPLHKLRAQGQLTELRQKDLQFSAAETAVFLQNIIRGDVEEKTAVDLTAKTEGWVTGLRLAALSMRHHDASYNLLANLPQNIQYVTQYLLNEVLAHQPEEIQEFLLKTSILNRLSMPLCVAVCCSVSDDTLVQLHQQNLFVIPLDHQATWFRYHHLFQELLQHQLSQKISQEEIKELHRQASYWFADNDLPDEALQHAIWAKDIAYAEQLVEKYRYPLMNTEQWRRLDQWLNMLPAETVESNPLLLHTNAFIVDRNGDVPQVFAIRDQVEAMLANLPENSRKYDALRAETAAYFAYQYSFGGDAQTTIEYATKAIELAPDDALHVRSYGIGFRFLSHQMLGEFDEGLKQVDAEVRQSRHNTVFQAKLVYTMCAGTWMEGDLYQLERQAQQLLTLGQENNLSESISFARYYLGGIYYARNDVAKAKTFFKPTVDQPYSTGSVWVAFSAIALVLCYLAENQSEKATAVIESAIAHFTQTNDMASLAIIHAFQVEMALRQGNVAEATALSQQAVFDVLPPLWLIYISQLTAVKLLLAQNTSESLEEAAASLSQFDAYLASIHRNTIRVDSLALKALIFAAQKEDEKALKALSESLILAERGGFIRNYVDCGPQMAALLSRLHAQGEKQDFIAHILAAFPNETNGISVSRVTSSHSIQLDHLTKREKQVLQLLATDLATDEIASELHLSVATLRTHTKNIYNKLDVHSRIEAVAVAQELNL